jgi:hypothetical protein
LVQSSEGHWTQASSSYNHNQNCSSQHVVAFVVNITIYSTQNFTGATLRLRNQNVVMQLKNDWQWQYKPHPRTLLQCLKIALTAVAIKHTGKSTE